MYWNLCGLGTVMGAPRAFHKQWKRETVCLPDRNVCVVPITVSDPSWAEESKPSLLFLLEGRLILLPPKWKARFNHTDEVKEMCHKNKTNTCCQHVTNLKPTLKFPWDSYSGKNLLLGLATPRSYRLKVQSDSFLWCLIHKTAKYSTISLSQNILWKWTLELTEFFILVRFYRKSFLWTI